MRQVNVALLVTRREVQPFFYSVYDGSGHFSTTARNMLPRLPKCLKPVIALLDNKDVPRRP